MKGAREMIRFNKLIGMYEVIYRGQYWKYRDYDTAKTRLALCKESEV